MSETTNPATIPAIQFMLIALIASHPNKKELLAQFDKLSSEHQIAAVGVGGGTPAELRQALEGWRSLIEAST